MPSAVGIKEEAWQVETAALLCRAWARRVLLPVRKPASLFALGVQSRLLRARASSARRKSKLDAQAPEGSFLRRRFPGRQLAASRVAVCFERHVFDQVGVDSL